MIALQQHNIDKVFLEVYTKNTGTANTIKDEINTFLEEEVLPDLERYFSSLEEEFGGQNIQIPKLNIDVTNADGFSDLSTLKYKIKKNTEQAIQEVLKEKYDKNSKRISITTQDESNLQTFLHFLEHGTKPWWSSSKNDFENIQIEIEKSTKQAKNNFTRSFKRILKKVEAQIRLINQFSNQQIRLLIQQNFEDTLLKTFFELTEMSKKVDNLNVDDKPVFWNGILNYLIESDAKRLDVEKVAEIFCKNRSVGKNKESENLFYLIETLIHTIYQKEKAVEVTRQFYKRISVSFPEKMLDKSFSESNKNDDKLEKLTKGEEQSNSIQSEKLDDKNAKKSVETKEELKNVNDAINSSTLDENSESNKRLQSDKKDIQKDVNEPHHKEIKTKEMGVSKTDFDKENQVENNAVDSSTKGTDKENGKVESATDTDSINSISEKEAKENSSDISNETVSKTQKEDNHQKVNDEQMTSSNSGSSSQKDVSQNEKTGNQKVVENALDTSDSKKVAEIKKGEPKEDANREDQFDIDELFQQKTELYAQNAGLILLHPFLKDFFLNCNIIDEKMHFINAELGAHLLHYLATKQENQYESELVFEKFLCKIPSKKSIRREIIISEELKGKSEEMLQASLRYWEPMKNASPDLLRSEFLQRLGKISFKENSPRIVIERKTHDILLDKLPWTLSMCKLPWMKKILFTDW